MKYKVGDMVRVRSDLEVFKEYGRQFFVPSMEWLKGEILTIEKTYDNGYAVKGSTYIITDEMLEQVEELSAEEAIKSLTDMCDSFSTCDTCPISKEKMNCSVFKKLHPEKVLEILKQWKAEHEKKPIKTEWSWWVEIIDKKSHVLVHEEKLNASYGVDYQAEKIYKKYISEHDGECYLVKECRHAVKE